MTVFFVVAMLLTAVAALFASMPLWRNAGTGASPERLTGAVTAVLLAAASVSAYLLISHGAWRDSLGATARVPAAGPGEETIESLLQGTRAKPNQVQPWLRLGSGYLRANQWALARRSFRRADALAGGRSAEALVGLAQSVEVEQDGAESDAALDLYERAVQLDSQSPPALFYSAVALMRAGKLPLARSRFAAMLALQPPAGVSDALSKQIASIDAAVAADARGAQVDVATVLHLRIDLAPALRSRVKSGAVLFVFVRSPQGGPPLAVKRLTPNFPQLIELSAADSVMAGNLIKPGQKVLVVARVSESGAPTGGPGDLLGQIDAVAGQSKPLDLLISKAN